MMDFHYNVINTEFEGKYNLLYSDTDSLVYDIQHRDIYDWIKTNKSYFDLSDSMRPDLKDDANNIVLGKFKHEMNSLIMKEWLALNPKVYNSIHEHFDKKQKLYLKQIPKKVNVLVRLLLKIILLTMIMLKC